VLAALVDVDQCESNLYIGSSVFPRVSRTAAHTRAARPSRPERRAVGAGETGHTQQRQEGDGDDEVRHPVGGAGYRERYGIPYYVFFDQLTETVAPLVTRLAGE